MTPAWGMETPAGGRGQDDIKVRNKYWRFVFKTVGRSRIVLSKIVGTCRIRETHSFLVDESSMIVDRGYSISLETSFSLGSHSLGHTRWIGHSLGCRRSYSCQFHASTSRIDDSRRNDPWYGRITVVGNRLKGVARDWIVKMPLQVVQLRWAIWLWPWRLPLCQWCPWLPNRYGREGGKGTVDYGIEPITVISLLSLRRTCGAWRRRLTTRIVPWLTRSWTLSSRPDTRYTVATVDVYYWLIVDRCCLLRPDTSRSALPVASCLPRPLPWEVR